MPYTADVHVDQALTTLSVAYVQEGLIADSLLPPAPVDTRTGLYFVYGKESFKSYDTLTRPGSVSQEFVYTVSRTGYSAERHSLRGFITDDVTKEATAPLNMEVDTTEQLTAAIQNSREFDVLGQVTNPAVVTQNLTLSGTTQWSDYTNSTPLSDIRSAKSAVRLGALREATDFTLSYDAAQVLADHPSIKELIKYTDPNNISTSGLPSTLRGLKVNVSSAFRDTANAGQVANLVGAFGDNALIHYTESSPGLKKLSFGYRFEAPDATTGVRGFATIRYRDEPRHLNWLEVGTTYTTKIIAPLAGFLIVAPV